MVDTASPTVVIDPRLEAGVSLLGVLAAVAAAYYAGTTGNWEPLLAISLGLVCVVVFVTSE